MRRASPLLGLFVAASLPTPALGAVTIGGQAFPHGENAFPSASTCLDPTGCGGEDNVVHDFTHPLIPPVSPANALLGHRLDLVALDLDEFDEIELELPRPLRNQPGADLYLAQAWFLTGLADAQGLNDLDVSLDDGPWCAIALTEFAEDTAVSPPIVTYSDPELKQDAYRLWFVTLDISECGVAEKTLVERVTVRGSVNLGNSGLDLAIVGSLRRKGGCGLLGVEAVVLLTALRFRRRRLRGA